MGHIKLYRSLLDDPDWYNKKPFDKGKAWVDLLLRADHKQSEVDIQKEVVQVRRGQVFTSKRKLARDWNRDYRTIDSWLNCWKIVGKVQHKSDRDKEHGYTLITINNWDMYQCDENKSTAQSQHKLHTNNISKSFKGKSQGSDPVFLSDLTPEQRKEVLYVKWD
jgi:hypothetical protein